MRTGTRLAASSRRTPETLLFPLQGDRIMYTLTAILSVERPTRGTGRVQRLGILIELAHSAGPQPVGRGDGHVSTLL
jgi:hypothetical protein